jgi:hypothetical protein
MAHKKYALIVDNEVFGVLSFDDDPSVNPTGPRYAAGLSSNPMIVEVDSSITVQHGWIWDGTTVKPSEE